MLISFEHLDTNEVVGFSDLTAAPRVGDTVKVGVDDPITTVREVYWTPYLAAVVVRHR